MKFQLNIVVILIFICVHVCIMMEINLSDTEVYRNVLKFGYGINYEYVGTLSHSFDRFYVVTKFELPNVKDLEFTTMPYDTRCKHLDATKTKEKYPLGLVNEIKEYCIKIAPHIDYYKKQVDCYNYTTYEILINKLALILPIFSKQERQKRGIIISLITGFIGMAY